MHIYISYSTYHIVIWGHKLDTALAQLCLLFSIGSSPCGVKMAEVGRRRLINHAAYIATPFATIIGPRCKRVNVSATTLTTNDASVTKVNNVDSVVRL